jgi:ABC-2 type transport system permease protein
MGIFTDNPVLGREMRSRLRLRKIESNKPLAVVSAVVGLGIVWFYIKGLVGIAHGQVDDARSFWSYLVLFLLLLIVIITPALLSTAITQEREQQTWEALATTRLTAAQVLLGKWLGRLSLAVLPVVILLPFLIGCAVKGALNLLTLPITLLFFVVTIAGYGVLGLLCSFFSRKTVSATVTALTITIALCVGTPIVAAMMPDFLRAATSDYTYQDPIILWFNPFYALSALVSSVEPQGVGALSVPDTEPATTVAVVYLMATLLAGGAGLLYMITHYRRAVRE